MRRIENTDIKGWPKDDKVAQFEKLADSVRCALEAAYTFERKPSESISWTGPSLGWRTAARAPDAEDALSKKWLEYEKERGRDALDVLITIALQLGIEQGRRIEKAERTDANRSTRAMLELALKHLQ